MFWTDLCVHSKKLMKEGSRDVDEFQFFQGGEGTILTDFLGGGAKYEKKQIISAKTTKKS